MATKEIKVTIKAVTNLLCTGLRVTIPVKYSLRTSFQAKAATIPNAVIKVAPKCSFILDLIL